MRLENQWKSTVYCCNTVDFSRLLILTLQFIVYNRWNWICVHKFCMNVYVQLVLCLVTEQVWLYIQLLQHYLSIMLVTLYCLLIYEVVCDCLHGHQIVSAYSRAGLIHAYAWLCCANIMVHHLPLFLQASLESKMYALFVRHVNTCIYFYSMQ